MNEITFVGPWTSVPLDGPPRVDTLTIRRRAPKGWRLRFFSLPPMIHAACDIAAGQTHLFISCPLFAREFIVYHE